MFVPINQQSTQDTPPGGGVGGDVLTCSDFIKLPQSKRSRARSIKAF